MVWYLSGAENEGTKRLAADYQVGVIAGPGKWSVDRVLPYRAYAADNGCFATGDRFDLDYFLRWLDTMPRETCLFAVSPDVLADAAATWARSEPVLPQLRALGFKAALVAQDGFRPDAVDWSAFDCLFIGGTTEYKLSEPAYEAIAEAKRRGKWAHMGRVNSLRRLRAAKQAGCDSTDGTYLKFGPLVNEPRVREWLAALDRQPSLRLF